MALSFDQLFDTIVIRINGPEAFKQPTKYLEKEITIDFMVEDVDQVGKPGAGWHLRLSNAALTGHAVPYTAFPNPRNAGISLTVWLKHQELVYLVGGTTSGNNPNVGKFTTSGDLDAWSDITSRVTIPKPSQTLPSTLSPLEMGGEILFKSILYYEDIRTMIMLTCLKLVSLLVLLFPL